MKQLTLAQAGVQTMMYAGEVPWHGLGQKVEGLQTSKEAIVKAGLDWQVQKHANEYTIKEGRAKVRMVGKGFQVIRMDNKESLGNVGTRWTPHQNREAFALMDEVIGRKAAVYETAGALGRGEKIWLLAKVKGLITIGGEDVVEKYLLAANAHDGTKSFKLAVTTIRPVCGNTLHLALKEADGAEQVFSIRHTSKLEDKVQKIVDYLQIASKKFEDFKDAAQAMTKVKMNTKKFNEFLGLLGFDPEAEGGKKESIITDLRDAFESAPGSQLETAKGTLWGALNAVTYYTTHKRTTRQTKSSGFKSENEARLNSSWFGSGNDLNQKALAVATQMVEA
jgi:phage/plasmid-like protein (TIGR03299 family)